MRRWLQSQISHLRSNFCKSLGNVPVLRFSTRTIYWRTYLYITNALVRTRTFSTCQWDFKTKLNDCASFISGTCYLKKKTKIPTGLATLFWCTAAVLVLLCKALYISSKTCLQLCKCSQGTKHHRTVTWNLHLTMSIMVFLMIDFLSWNAE